MTAINADRESFTTRQNLMFLFKVFIKGPATQIVTRSHISSLYAVAEVCTKGKEDVMLMLAGKKLDEDEGQHDKKTTE